MLWGDHEERRAEERVGPGGKHWDVGVELLDPEDDLGALATTDPVALDRLRALGPLASRRQVVLEQLVGIGGDLHEPLLHVPRLDQRTAPPAAAVDDVLVRENRLVVRAPVDGSRLPVGEPALEELEEQPLRPAVEVGLVGADLAIPVDRPADPLHLLPDRDDVPLDDVAGVTTLADRGVLGR